MLFTQSSHNSQINYKSRKVSGSHFRLFSSVKYLKQDPLSPSSCLSRQQEMPLQMLLFRSFEKPLDISYQQETSLLLLYVG